MQTESCYSETAMLTVEQARQQMLQQVHAVSGTETLTLLQLRGRVVSKDYKSPIDVPGYDNSAMDGYAVAVEDVVAIPAQLQMSQRIPAGTLPQPLQPHTAARIFTGAQIPAGANAVVMQEQCQENDTGVQINHSVEHGQNIRPRGNGIAQAEQIIRAGTRLQSTHIALLASVGIADVVVQRKVRVALISTGDELVEPGQPLGASQIYNSNRYALLDLLQQHQCEIVDIGIVEDTFAATKQALLIAAEQCDLVITTGGVSVGEEDHVKNALEAEGELQLWKIRMKPGKPVAFGQLGNSHFLGLPGNPVSAVVTFMLFGLPLLRKLSGQSGDLFPQPQPVELGWNWSKAQQRREFIRVQLQHRQIAVPVAIPYPKQGSDVLSGLTWADGLAELPEFTTLQQGNMVNYWSLQQLLA